MMVVDWREGLATLFQYNCQILRPKKGPLVNHLSCVAEGKRFDVSASETEN